MKSASVFVFLTFLAFTACKKNVDSKPGVANGIVAESNVPDVVLNSFSDDFSGATEREWIYDDDNYTCQFNLDDKRQQAEFDEDGHKSSSSVICIDAAVPAAVLQSFRSNFPNDVVYEWKLTSDNDWKAHFLRGSVKWEVTFNNAGNIIKSEHE